MNQLTRSIFAALPFILPSGIEDIDLIAASCSVNNEVGANVKQIFIFVHCSLDICDETSKAHLWTIAPVLRIQLMRYANFQLFIILVENVQGFIELVTALGS
ncbi:hypothetical protein A9C11_06375 [Pseudomonas citronellolis]|uniref:Uncharacterized protein n=1 Tax=Pseudomonas citronellolis TaxID=53408 RepID=A0A1A9K7W8_9PSED|nr:hypothetical protein A9C11_06375 [Pseudomonas citronellolis]